MIGVIDCIYLSRLMRTAFSISTAIEEKGQLPPIQNERKEMRLHQAVRNMGEGCKQIGGRQSHLDQERNY